MKQKIKITKEIEVEVKTIVVQLPVRYGEEQIPNDFPLRTGDVWRARIDIDTGKIEGWPDGNQGRELELQVCDDGVYVLLNSNDKEIARRVNNYVPHGVIPGAWGGDYVTLDIGPDGVIQNWPINPDVSEFFSNGEE